MNVVREPVVAGRFYEGTEAKLRAQIEGCYTHPHGPGEVPSPKGTWSQPAGIIVPHAGYPYSGPVAAHAFDWLSRRGRPPTVVVVGTKHSAGGAELALMEDGEWETPLGKVPIDSELAGLLLEGDSPLEVSEAAFRAEHSVEVELPFLQHLYGSRLKFVPICMRAQGPEKARKLGSLLAGLEGRRPAVVASSDFSHYERQQVAEEKDRQALEAISSGDIDELYSRIEEEKISICGYGPIAALMQYAKLKDLRAAELKYATSGEITGRRGEVVGYAAMAFGGSDHG